MKLDFPVRETVIVDSETELFDAMQAHDRIRLAGSGGSQAFVPAPEEPVTVVSLAGMNRILRLEADDLTCSVEPGVRREDLDHAMAGHGLHLPCGGSGTIGGIFAADSVGSLAPGRPEPRNLLLGISAVLSEGLRFRSGARVVKNVAGFDLQKVFVGSRGRLFAVTALHLKLRPLPRNTFHFALEDLPRDAAVETTRRLRHLSEPPLVLVLNTHGGGRDWAPSSVCGTLGGHPRHVSKLARELELTAGPEPDLEMPAPDDGVELVQGQIPSRRLAELIEQLPDGAPFRLCGQRFTVSLASDAADRLLDRLSTLGGSGEILVGPATRRGRKTPADAAVERLTELLKASLDARGALR